MNDFKEITIASYDKTAEEFAAKTQTFHPTESAEVLSLLPKKAKILDLGCGPGRDTAIFAQKGFEVMGVDLSEKMIELARTRVKNATFKVMDATKLEFGAETFDCVWANAIFLHIPKSEIKQALTETFRVLKKGGILYVAVKEGEGEILLPDARYGGVEKFWDFFKKDEIENLITDAGFSIIKSQVLQKMSYDTNPFIRIISRKS
jgi:ubiquinone/menaquinone biosynthesis C-methylase UbiE